MKIYQGWSRTAYVFDKFTVKAARIPLLSVARSSSREIRWFATKSNVYESDNIGAKYLRQQLVRNFGVVTEGIVSNIWEGYGSLRLKGAVIPTTFSLFGFINVMRTVPVPVEEFTFDEKVLILNALAPFAEKTNQYTDWHTFHNSKNYGLDKGILKLLDYGNHDALKTLLVTAEVHGRSIRGIDALQETIATIQRARGL